jgi:hypothetical protein
MSLEERILQELKAEVAARADRRRRARTARRLFAGAAAAGLAAAAAIAVPLLTGTERPAYALSRNPDGSIRVQIIEFRDPDRLEADLARHGVRADVTYLEPGTGCANALDGGGPAPEDKERLSADPEEWIVRPGDDDGHVVLIDPRDLKPGWTVVLRFGADPGSDRAMLGWTVVDGPAPECDVVRVPEPASGT